MKYYILLIMLISSIKLTAVELDLESCWEKLLADSPQLQSEQLTVRSKEADVKLALYDLLPSGNLSGSYNRNGDNDLEDDNMNYLVSLSQPLYQGGRLVNNLNQHEKSLQQAQENYRSLLLDLRLQLENKYFTVLELQESLNTLRNEQIFLETNLQTALIRFENGSLARGDLLQLRSQAAQKEVSLLKAENNLQIAINDLMNFLMVKDEIELTPLDIGDYEEVISNLGSWQIADIADKEAALIAFSRENNPLIRVSKLSVEISENGVQSAKGNFLPNLSLSLSKSWNYQDWDSDPEGSMSMGISASVPVFPIADNIQTYTKSRYSLKQSKLNLNLAQLDLELDIKSSLLNLTASVQEIKAAEIFRDYALESYQQAEESFRNRMITANELLNTQISLTTAENALTNATYDFLGYKGELQKNLGIMKEKELWKWLIQ